MFSVDHISFKEINKDNKIKLILKCNNNDLADYAIKMVNYNKELPLIEIETLIINDSSTLIYDITNCIRLSNAIEENSISLQEMLQVIGTILFTLANLKSYFLNSNNIFLNINYTFYNYVTKEIELIYLPFINEVTNAYMNQKIFLLDLLLICKKYCVNCESLDMAIMELRDDTGTLESIKEKLDLVKDEVRRMKEQENMLIKDKTEKRSFFSVRKKENNIVIKTTEIRSNRIEYLNLVIYEGDRVKTINLDKEKYLLGRLEGAVDIPIRNSSVGRIHGRIEREDYYYFYVDLESKNGSFINGERLEPNKRYPLENGDNIKLANVSMYLKGNRSI
ncbi:FHA domain-containing protein [Clostridium paraputrificum]